MVAHQQELVHQDTHGMTKTNADMRFGHLKVRCLDVIYRYVSPYIALQKKGAVGLFLRQFENHTKRMES